jgi:hypothetical protein
MFLPQTLIHWVTVIGLVTDHALGCCVDEATFDGGFDQLYFVR